MYGRSWFGVYVVMCVPYAVWLRVKMTRNRTSAQDVYIHVAATICRMLLTLLCVCVWDRCRLLRVYVMCVYPI